MQESKNVEKYTREFERLMTTCDIWESEDQMVVRYLIGLNESIKNLVEYTLDELQHHPIHPQWWVGFILDISRFTSDTQLQINKQAYADMLPFSPTYTHTLSSP